MLPGFRFLFAATFLTMSILVFGLGAAALLRAAHEQFATNPAWHAAPEATFAQQVEPTRAVLAMLRVGGPAADQKPSGDTPGADVPAISAPPEQATTVPAAAEPATIAALKPEPLGLPAAAKPDLTIPESPASGAAAAAPGDAPASDPTKAAAPAPSSETMIASPDRAIAESPSPPDPAAAGVDAAASSPAPVAASPEADFISAKIAALDAPSVTVEAKPPATMIGPKPDPRTVEKQLRARRAAHRRRMAARAARLARLAALQLLQQQAADPFGLRFAQPAAAAMTPVAPVHGH